MIDAQLIRKEAGVGAWPNKRFDTDPQQQRSALLFRAGQSRRSASC
jgi:hypothetical protein